MPKFMFIYHGGSAPESPEEGEKVMAAWDAWMSGMGKPCSMAAILPVHQ